MKKTKILRVLIVLILNLILMFSLVKVNAYDGPIDPDKKIRFSMVAFNGEGKIYVSTSVDPGFQLHYQPVEVPPTDFETYQTKTEAWEIEVDEYDARISEKNTELSNVTEDYNQKANAYNTLVKQGVTGEELENARIEVDQAYEILQNIETERDAIKNEYKNRYNEFLEEIRPLYQTFNNANWREGISTEANKTFDFIIDKSEFSGEKGFAIWVRLTEVDNTITYNRAIYTVTGSKSQNIKVDSFSLNKKEISLKVGEKYTLIPSFVPVDATNKNITWKSSNNNIATVSTTGVVTAKSVGNATITATTSDGGLVDSCKVTVTGVTNKTNEPDNTKAPGKLPDAGKKIISLILVSGIILLGIVSYRKYSKYSDI